jgi:tryptophanyl-tRNA synthetase
VALHDTHRQFLLADAQAMTDNAHDIDNVRRNVIEVALDYLAVGIDPVKRGRSHSLVAALFRLARLTGC